MIITVKFYLDLINVEFLSNLQWFILKYYHKRGRVCQQNELERIGGVLWVIPAAFLRLSLAEVWGAKRLRRLQFPWVHAVLTAELPVAFLCSLYSGLGANVCFSPFVGPGLPPQ